MTEHVSDQTIRPRLTREQIAALLPRRGPFLFPSPYLTQGVRITNEDDGTVHPVAMSYWSSINAHAARRDLAVLLSIDDQLVVSRVDKTRHEVIGTTTLPYHATGESCYWSLSNPDVCFVLDAAHNQLVRVNVATGEESLVFQSGDALWQCHSNFDGTVHSMTLGGQPAVVRRGALTRFDADVYDECQIDKSGRWLLIKAGATNRIIDLDTRREWTIDDAAGAIGHSDMGFGYMVGEEDQTAPGGVFRVWRFTDDGPQNDGHVHYSDWTPMSRYVSHCNAIDAPIENQRVLYSGSVNDDRPRANELVLGRLDGSFVVKVLCPNLADLTAPGGGDEYWRKTRANLDPSGQYACWSANMGTERMDVFLVRVA